MHNIDHGSIQLRVDPFGKSLSASFLLHFAVVLLLFRLTPLGAPVRLHAPQVSLRSKSTILYVVPVSEKLMVFAKINGAEGGGAAGKGTVPGKPALGSTDFNRKLTTVSNPVHPNNTQQLIVQPSTPPDLLIKQELKLPNSILGTPFVMPREQVDIVLTGPKRMPIHRSQSAKLNSPALPAPADGLNVAAVPAIQTPHMPVPAAPEMHTDGVSKSPSTAPSGGGADTEGASQEERSLLALSTDPGKNKIALPPGNKYGEFSFSPAGDKFGSPGGSGTVAIAGGTEGLSAGGDGSTGVALGKDGGGGNSSDSAMVSLNGTGAIGAGGYQMMIFPVPPNPTIRKNNMVISAGPIGGGGLGVYKALPCGRIFTTFLPMPAANWILEYCTSGKSSARPTPSNATTIQLEESVAPPAPLQTFDFRRPALGKEPPPKNLILKGSIREDGTVANLQVYQGVMREFDELAKATFNLWKFMPATRAGKPVAVEILVGIPSLAQH
jgi:hypothetical protein